MQVQIQKQKAITLIALVITVVILLILTGVAIATLSGEEGLIANVEKAKLEQMKAEAKENINMAIIEIQTQEIPKGENVTLEILNNKLNTVDNRIQPKKYTVGDIELKGIYIANQNKKFNFIIDEKLNVKIEEAEEGAFPITVTDIEKTSLRVTGDVSALQTPIANYTYVAQTSSSNQIKFENITATSYTVTGLELGTEYDVYMLAYDNAGNVTKSNVETVTTKNPEIQVTTPYIGTSTTETDSTKSVADNSQTRGTTLYINFSATLEGTACTITLKDDTSKILPYEITTNGTYIFIATGTYGGKTVTKEIEVTVNKYKSATGLVKYNAGDWTESEIQSLKTAGLYNLNASCSASNTSGLNFTFGGFTNKESSDATNSNIVTSKDKSVKIGYKNYVPQYDGWQILESKEENGKTYVTKIVHAGCPENFVYYYTTSNDSYRAEYILSSGLRRQDYNTYSPRSWQMYIDNSQRNLIADTTDKNGNIIKDIHAMTYDEAYAITANASSTDTLQKTGSYYWLGSARSNFNRLWLVLNGGSMSGYIKNYGCFGVRPVVSLKSGVYIASGEGTEASPYVLGIENNN